MNNESSTPGKSIGRTMLIAGWIILFVGLTYIFGQLQERQYNPNQIHENTGADGISEITLVRNKYQHYVATGKINGSDVIFMLDTGATDVAIPAHLARKLGLKKGTQAVAMTANGRVKVWKSSINILELGPIRLYDVTASLNPGMTGNEILLGMSALKEFELIQRGKELTIRQIK